MKRTFLFITICFASLHSAAQSNIDAVLSQVATNNKTIVAEQQHWEAKKLEYKTGISLPNPQAEYDYLWGNPSNVGNETEFVAYQPFDFPTSYIKRRQAADLQIAQADFFVQSKRQDVLLEAKVVCIELVYRNKLQTVLNQRLQQTQKLAADFQTRLDKGYGNQLELNKAKLQVLQTQSAAAFNETEITQLNSRLTDLNGGVALTFNDTVYPALPELPAFEALEQTIEESDPARKALEQQQLIAEKQVEVSKSLWLPSLQAGYKRQTMLGQQFNGLHIGVGIPLWERKNSVRFQRAELLAAQYRSDEHRTEHYYDINRQYEQYQTLKTTFETYRSQLSLINNIPLATKAFELGEFSSAEYFLEVSYFNNAVDNFLELEMQLQRSVAELMKYQL